MCRLLGAVAPRPAELSALLETDLGPFTGLSAEHCDGWGIARHRDEGPEVHKAPEAAYLSAGFGDAVATTRTDAALLHLRLASAGLAVAPENTHPFTDGTYALAHNGFVGPVAVLDDLLAADPRGTAPIGGTDSERWFRLLLARLPELGPVAAFGAVAADLREVCHVESLNSLLLTPDALYAFVHFDDDAVLARGGTPGSYGMAYRESAAGVVVASNGWEQPTPAWRELANGTVLEIRRGDPVGVTAHRVAERFRSARAA